MWFSHGSCSKIVEDGWGTLPCNTMGDVVKKIKLCSDALEAWNKSDFCHVQSNIRKKRIIWGI